MLWILISASQAQDTWSPTAFPLPYTIGSGPSSMSQEEFETDVRAAAEAWKVGECGAPLFVESPADAVVTIEFDEDSIEIFGIGQRCEGEGDARQCQVWLNDLLEWTTDAEALATECESAWSVSWMVGHELGHVIGLAHTAEESDDIPKDSSILDSLMHWRVFCDRATAMNADDQALFSQTYSTEPVLLLLGDPAPTEVQVLLGEDLDLETSFDGAHETNWFANDASIGTGSRVTAGPFKEPGLTAIRAEVSWEHPFCDATTADLGIDVRVFGVQDQPQDEEDQGCGDGRAANALVALAPWFLLRRRRIPARPHPDREGPSVA